MIFISFAPRLLITCVSLNILAGTLYYILFLHAMNNITGIVSSVHTLAVSISELSPSWLWQCWWLRLFVSGKVCSLGQQCSVHSGCKTVNNLAQPLSTLCTTPSILCIEVFPPWLYHHCGEITLYPRHLWELFTFKIFLCKCVLFVRTMQRREYCVSLALTVTTNNIWVSPAYAAFEFITNCISW